jgi:alkanesulfonate monooxygenase SsuD/methylene tetrahydromethanopterin reductase-like flavin-dependent oxidoreductase (luciferase family)
MFLPRALSSARLPEMRHSYCSGSILTDTRSIMTKMAFGIHLPSRSAVDFRAILSYARRCEDLGIDSVWVADHILSGDSGGLYEPLTMLSALSGSTEEVHLGTSVLITSLRNPILLADIAGTIQETSGGRLTLGVGAGWDEHEFESLGVQF